MFILLLFFLYYYYYLLLYNIIIIIYYNIGIVIQITHSEHLQIFVSVVAACPSLHPYITVYLFRAIYYSKLSLLSLLVNLIPSFNLQ